jgi:hypothetical protein
MFERPYHKKNSNELHSNPIYGVYSDEPHGISNKFIKLQILGHQQLTLLIWPLKHRHNRSTRLRYGFSVVRLYLWVKLKIF